MIASSAFGVVAKLGNLRHLMNQNQDKFKELNRRVDLIGGILNKHAGSNSEDETFAKIVEDLHAVIDEVVLFVASKILHNDEIFRKAQTKYIKAIISRAGIKKFGKMKAFFSKRNNEAKEKAGEDQFISAGQEFRKAYHEYLRNQDKSRKTVEKRNTLNPEKFIEHPDVAFKEMGDEIEDFAAKAAASSIDMWNAEKDKEAVDDFVARLAVLLTDLCTYSQLHTEFLAHTNSDALDKLERSSLEDRISKARQTQVTTLVGPFSLCLFYPFESVVRLFEWPSYVPLDGRPLDPNGKPGDGALATVLFPNGASYTGYWLGGEPDVQKFITDSAGKVVFDRVEKARRQLKNPAQENQNPKAKSPPSTDLVKRNLSQDPLFQEPEPRTRALPVEFENKPREKGAEFKPRGGKVKYPGSTREWDAIKVFQNDAQQKVPPLSLQEHLRGLPRVGLFF